MNNAEIRQWINNDEGLYNWFNSWKRGRHGSRSMDLFIKENRKEIVAAIKPVLDGTKPAHHLAYGG
jgi:ribonucleotide reductase beta subunit family protein with ferritin-like domain